MENEHIVIVGGGFAGVWLARRLEKKLPKHVAISLLSEESYLLYSPLLPEVVGGTLLPAHTVAPLRQMLKRTDFHRAMVEGVDFKKREICFRADTTLCNMSYTQLVFACGRRANLSLVPGMEEHAFPLKTVGDALEIRNRILLQLERAAVTPEPEERRRLLDFAVVGGGANGVEVAGAVYDMLRAAEKFYPDIAEMHGRVKLFHAGDTLLPEMPETLGRFAGRDMEQRGIELHLDVHVSNVDAQGVSCDGIHFGATTVICSIGSDTFPFIKNLDLPLVRGSIDTEPDLSVKGHDGLWAIGDCAAILNGADGKPAPPTAQFATREGVWLADNLNRRLRGRATRPFRYKPKGMLITVGHQRAVTRVYRINLRGFFAWLLWRAYYLAKIPTALRRVQIFFEWGWQMLFPPDVSQYHYVPYRLADGRRYTFSEPPPGEACRVEPEQSKPVE